MKKCPIRLPILALAALTASPALADAGDGFHGHYMMGGAGWIFGPLMMFIFIGLIVGAIVITLRLLGFESRKGTPDRSLDILKERFAKGEIDKEEFEDRKRALGN